MSEPENQLRAVPSVFVTGLFQFFAGLLLFLALLYRQQVLIYLALLVLIMFWGSRVWCRLSLSALKHQLSVNHQRVFPGERILLQARVENIKFLPVWLKIEIPVPRRLHALSQDRLTDEAGLLWYQAADLHWQLTAGRRGHYRIGPSRIHAGDFLGFYQREKTFRQCVEVLVYPRLIPLNPLTLPLRDLFGEPGVNHPVPDPVYPVATRDYQYGRPARHIHWKASARQNRLQEKFFEASSQHKTALMIDVAAFEEKGAVDAFERTLEVAASLAVLLKEHGSQVGLITNGSVSGKRKDGNELPGTKESQPVSAILETLARLEIKPFLPMEELLLQGQKLHRGMAGLYFCHSLDSRVASARDIVQVHNIPMVFFTFIPPDADAVELPGLKSCAVYSIPKLQEEEATALG